MKPAWEQLEKEFASSKTVVVGNVDCTADNAKDLCSTYGVKGYPTIKYFTSGTGPDGEDYKGGRTFEDLKKFVAESGNFGPSCGVEHKDLCSDEQLAALNKYLAMPEAERKTMITEADATFKKIDETFKEEVSKLQATYEGLMKTKEADEAAWKEANKFIGIAKGLKAGDGHAEL
jgi:hypothetical protein